MCYRSHYHCYIIHYVHYGTHICIHVLTCSVFEEVTPPQWSLVSGTPYGRFALIFEGSLLHARRQPEYARYYQCLLEDMRLRNVGGHSDAASWISQQETSLFFRPATLHWHSAKLMCRLYPSLRTHSLLFITVRYYWCSFTAHKIRRSTAAAAPPHLSHKRCTKWNSQLPVLPVGTKSFVLMTSPAYRRTNSTWARTGSLNISGENG